MNEIISSSHFRNTAGETVRTLLVYGYVLDPPSGDHADANEVDDETGGVEKHHSRTYRLEKTYGVSSGKWYKNIYLEYSRYL